MEIRVTSRNIAVSVLFDRLIHLRFFLRELQTLGRFIAESKDLAKQALWKEHFEEVAEVLTGSLKRAEAAPEEHRELLLSITDESASKWLQLCEGMLDGHFVYMQSVHDALLDSFDDSALIKETRYPEDLNLPGPEDIKKILKTATGNADYVLRFIKNQFADEEKVRAIQDKKNDPHWKFTMPGTVNDVEKGMIINNLRGVGWPRVTVENSAEASGTEGLIYVSVYYDAEPRGNKKLKKGKQ